MIEASGTEMQLGRHIGQARGRRAVVRLRRAEGRHVDGEGGDSTRHKHGEEGARRVEKRLR